MKMTIQQDWAIKEFENELRRRGHPKVDWEESNIEITRGCLFGNFMGVTLMVYPEGLISIPAVCSYTAPSPAVAATSAKERFARQKARDDDNPARAQKRRGGHLGPIVDLDLKCGNQQCRCLNEESEERRRRARGACNTLKLMANVSEARLEFAFGIPMLLTPTGRVFATEGTHRLSLFLPEE